MLGDLAAAIATLARTSPHESRTRPTGGDRAPSGNASAAGGEKLPVEHAPVPVVVDVAKAVARLNELMSSHRRSLRFEVDARSGRTVISVINDATNEVVRQIPPPELLQLAHNLESIGSLIDARA